MRSGSSAGSSATSLLLSVTEILWKPPNYFNPDRDLCSHPNENVYPEASVFKPSTETSLQHLLHLAQSLSSCSLESQELSPLNLFW